MNISRQQGYLDAFQEVTRLISSVHEPQEVMDLVVERLPRLMKVDGATIRLRDSLTGRFELKASYGLSQRYLTRPVIDTKEVMDALQAGKPTAMNLIAGDEEHRAQQIEGLKGTMSLPILHKGEVIGILRLLNRHHQDYTDSELDFAMSLAEQIGLAIVSARMFRQIQSHDRFLQTVLDSLWMQVLVVGRNGKVVLVNKNFLESRNISEKESVGQPYHKVTPWSEGDGDNNLMLLAFSRREPVSLLDSLGEGENTRWFQRDLTPLTGSEGDVEFVIETVRDITDQRQLEKEELRRMKLEGIVQMAGTAAHEFNSPLFAALGTAELLHEDLVEQEREPQIIADLEMIIRNMREIGALTRKMTKVTGYEEREYVGGTHIVKLHSEEE
jgi:PAS domain S-box-containing protein